MKNMCLNCNTLSNFNLKLVSVAIIVVLNCNIIQYANGCYITNCPWGGKRSFKDNSVQSFENNRQVCCGLYFRIKKTLFYLWSLF
jgi:hypothetical protein